MLAVRISAFFRVSAFGLRISGLQSMIFHQLAGLWSSPVSPPRVEADATIHGIRSSLEVCEIGHLQRAEESRQLAAYLLDVPPSLILDAASLSEIARVH